MSLAECSVDDFESASLSQSAVFKIKIKNKKKSMKRAAQFGPIFCARENIWVPGTVPNTCNIAWGRRAIVLWGALCLVQLSYDYRLHDRQLYLYLWQSKRKQMLVVPNNAQHENKDCIFMFMVVR